MHYLILLLPVCYYFVYIDFIFYILLIFFLVLDPRLKLQYYKDHNWEIEFIDIALEDIESLYKSNYAPAESVQDSVEDSSNDLLNHIYKQQRINDNELVQYLEIPIVSKETDILQWWKVMLNLLLLLTVCSDGCFVVSLFQVRLVFRRFE